MINVSQKKNELSNLMVLQLASKLHRNRTVTFKHSFRQTNAACSLMRVGFLIGLGQWLYPIVHTQAGGYEHKLTFHTALLVIAKAFFHKVQVDLPVFLSGSGGKSTLIL